MSKLTVDASLSQSLATLTQPVQLCDPSGRVLGRFEPIDDISEWESVDPNDEITEEELRRRISSTERRYTTAEVLAHLEKL
jgi:hypothetical protein